jgi:hypothetical protein
MIDIGFIDITLQPTNPDLSATVTEIVIQAGEQRLPPLEVFIPGVQGPRGIPGPVGATLEVTAQEFLPAYSIVLGSGYVADSSVKTDVNKSVGMVLDNIDALKAAPITTMGPIINPLWSWTGAGQKVYLNGTGLSQTAPTSGFVQAVGVTLSSTSLFLNLQDGIIIN